MAKVNLSTLKNWFKNGNKPLQEHFWNWLDSFWHKDEKIPLDAIKGLNNLLSQLPDAAQIQQCALRDASNLTAAQIAKWHTLLDLMKKSEYISSDGEIKADKIPVPDIDYVKIYNET